VVKKQQEDFRFRTWANAQWAIQPTYQQSACWVDADCSKEKNFKVVKFYYFPNSKICVAQTRNGDCSLNWVYREGEFDKMHAYFRASCWIQPERFPPWWRLPSP
jgi:hypothetical protein